jgi:DNA-binding transcriptional regulator YiaG
MPNVGSLLKDEITRVSRKEIRKETLATKKATSQHRHHIAALSKKVAILERQVAFLNRKVLTAISAPETKASPKKIRFSPKALLGQRNRLDLSAADFGSLVGVSAQSIYNWEQGKAVPRAEQLAKVAALRGVGKREAAQRLEQLQPE